MNAVKNFNIIAKRVKDTASSARAAEFAEKVTDQINSKGDAWISKNATALHISDSEAADADAPYSDAIAPIEDNRAWFLATWQTVLRKNS